MELEHSLVLIASSEGANRSCGSSHIIKFENPPPNRRQIPGITSHQCMKIEGDYNISVLLCVAPT